MVENLRESRKGGNLVPDANYLTIDLERGVLELFPLP